MQRTADGQRTADAVTPINARTIERLPAAGRRALQPRGSACTRPGSLLQHHIPVKSFAEWRDSEPGYTPMDCVGHDRGNAYGEFVV